MFVLIAILISSCFYNIGAQNTIVILPNSSLQFDCNSDSSCSSIQNAGKRIYSYYSLSNSFNNGHVVNIDGSLIIDNIGSEHNETMITCLSLEYTTLTDSFSQINGEETRLIVAAIPDRPDPPNIVLSHGCTCAVDWTAPFDNHKPIQHYVISLVGGLDTSEFTVLPSDLNYAIPDLNGGVGYSLSIAAVNEVGRSLDSMPANFEFPNQAPQPICNSVSTHSNSIQLSWDLPPANAISGSSLFEVAFEINYSGNGEEGTATSTGSFINLQSLTSNTEYSINVVAFVQGFTNCIQNSTCSLVVTTLSPTEKSTSVHVTVAPPKPPRKRNSAFSTRVDYTILFFTVFLFTLYFV